MSTTSETAEKTINAILELFRRHFKAIVCPWKLPGQNDALYPVIKLQDDGANFPRVPVKSVHICSVFVTYIIPHSVR